MNTVRPMEECNEHNKAKGGSDEHREARKGSDECGEARKEEWHPQPSKATTQYIWWDSSSAGQGGGGQ